MEEFDPERHRTERRQALPIGLAWLTVAPLVVVAGLRIVAHDATLELIVLNAVTPWLYLPAWPALGVALYFRRWTLVATAGVLALLHVLWMDPRSVVAARPPEVAEPAMRFRVMSANLLMVNRDMEGIVAELRASRPDLLLVQELTPEWVERFNETDFRALLPHGSEIPRTDSFGIGIYARSKLVVERFDLYELPALRAEMKVGERTLHVLNVHTLPPRTPRYVPIWNGMMQHIVELARKGPRPLLLGGDLNATTHARWYRELEGASLRGAHEERGRGFATTWPNGRFPFPPIRLDHFLVSPEIAVLDVWEGEGRGSDHRPIVADLVIR
jgi:endonuclease/exonuclease/phosphatase (EEP) superfamily protein YafD